MRKHRLAQNLIIITLMAVLCMLFGSVVCFAETLPAQQANPSSVTSSSSPVTTQPPTTLLPEANSKDIKYPAVIGDAVQKDEPSLGGGFVMWTIIGVAFAVILAVVLTSKTKAYRSGGKKRYSTGNKMGSGPHLLNEKYYHKRKK